MAWPLWCKTTSTLGRGQSFESAIAQGGVNGAEVLEAPEAIFLPPERTGMYMPRAVTGCRITIKGWIVRVLRNRSLEVGFGRHRSSVGQFCDHRHAANGRLPATATIR